jgi:hypothetical protein
MQFVILLGCLIVLHNRSRIILAAREQDKITLNTALQQPKLTNLR